MYICRAICKAITAIRIEQAVLNLNDTFFSVTNTEIINLSTQEKISAPQDLGKIDLAVPMKDLNLILVMNKTNQKVYAFSPTSKKFQLNTLVLPANADISTGETYLTYLYLADKNTNQIYRYPRATGGFGDKIDWKKDDTDIKGATAMTINENLFLIDGNNILKFFRGKKQDFSIESTATSIQPEKIWTTRDNENLYVLDTVNSRIVKMDANGQIIVEYYNPEIANAISFAVSETNNLVEFATTTDIKSFPLN